MAKKDDVMKGDITHFANDMRKIINNKDMSDIKFLIGPSRKAIHAHKCLLSARSEVFRVMFADQQHKHKDGEVPFVLSDTSPEIFLILLEYIYTNCATLNQKVATQVLGISIEYGLEGLTQLCVDFLVKNLSISTSCDSMQAAVAYGQDELKYKSIQYIQANTKKVFQSKSFHEMSAAALADILKSDDLDIDEKDILAAVKEWATVNSAIANRPMSVIAKPVVQHIRLPLLSPDELKTVEEDNKKDGLIPVSLLSYSWKCHALKSGEKDNPLTTKRKGTITRESHKGMQIL